MIHQMAKTQFTHVFLDARHMSENAFRDRFPGIYNMCISFDVNPSKQPIPVHPSAHYMVGRRVTDLFSQSSIEETSMSDRRSPAPGLRRTQSPGFQFTHRGGGV